MGTGWRRAFCNTATRDSRKDSVNDAETATTMDKPQQQSSSSSPRLSRTNPNTPRLRCNTSTDHHRKNSSNFSAIYNLVSPKLQCKTTPKSHSSLSKSPISVVGSYPSSPRSPFSILKNTLRSSSKNSCGACMQSVKTGQRTAIYTAECSHSFHFPCIAAHLKKQGSLTCPVCNVTWKNAPLLFNGIRYSEKEEEEKEMKTAGRADYQPRRQNVSPRFYQSKMFADDEPLLTPKASTPKFIVPIPEAANEEFQGFLPDPTIHSNALHDDHSSDSSKNVEITVSPESALVSATTYSVVLKVKAPPPLPTRRAPIDLVAVLDTSPSMSGPKLHMLQRAMRLVISSLGSADRLSLLSFSATPKRLMPLTRMTGQGQRFARRVINQLSCGYAHGGSSVAQALKLASTVLEDRRERNPVATIILLSDNNHRDENVPCDDDPNNNQRLGSSHVSSTRFSHVEIPVHSSSREDSEDAFSKCVGGLLSVVVQDLKINLDLACGSDPGEISAVYSAPNGRPTAHDANCINLGNLYAEEERELLVEIGVPEGTTNMMPYSHRHHHVFSIRCCYKDPSTHELVCGPERTQIIPQPLKIERLRNVFVATRAVAEGRRLLEHDEVNNAMRMLVSTRGLLLQSRPELAEDCVRMVEAELAEMEWKRKCRDQCRRHCGEAITSRTGGGGGNKVGGGYVRIRRGFDVVGDLHGFENARF